MWGDQPDRTNCIHNHSTCHQTYHSSLASCFNDTRYYQTIPSVVWYTNLPSTTTALPLPRSKYSKQITEYCNRTRYANTTGARTERDTRYPNELSGWCGRALIKNRYEFTTNRGLPPRPAIRTKLSPSFAFHVSLVTGIGRGRTAAVRPPLSVHEVPHE